MGGRNKTADSKRNSAEGSKRWKIGIIKKESGEKAVYLLASALLTCFLGGCRLAQEEAEAQNSEGDSLVGVFVTEEHLDVGMHEVAINSGGEVSLVEKKAEIAGRIVLDENGWQEIVFDGTEDPEGIEIKGFGIYDIKVWEEGQEHYTLYGIADNIFSDVYWATKSGDNLESNTVEATIYVEPGGPQGLYFNPVYQTSQGDIYMQPGSGLFSSERSEGMSGTHTISWKSSIAQAGQEVVEESSFAISITCAVPPTAYRLLFMGEDSRISKIMTGDELAEMWESGQWELKVPAGTAYLLLEQEKEDGDIGRVFCNKGEESLEFLQSAGGGYLVKRQMNIIWE